ncbi:universal stress protein [Novosphingobium sp.]|uniref:universal stress protein n=1 Tax=Novosphingobium sp. TaxID=1874826 RepID=UPI0027376789|nr:universal stress protein [Novosphingobium sp.]MDP3908271.1 universal stress protein [Novosphingobium sp.]
MRSILVQAGRDPGMSARLDTAMNIARAHEGHVTLLLDTPIDRYVTVDPYGGTYVARDALEAALKEDDALAEAFAGRLQNDDVPFDIAQYELPPVDALASGARLADITVVSRSGGLSGDLAMVSRTPVLALPDSRALQLPIGVACIAWDGGDEAAHALRAAVPLLQGAGAVHVLTVLTDKAEGFPPTDALRYLARHDIKAELHELPRGNSIEETLATASAQMGVQLMVMGAYGHSRVREFLFGGVTRYFLEEQAAPPLLLAH